MTSAGEHRYEPEETSGQGDTLPDVPPVDDEQTLIALGRLSEVGHRRATAWAAYQRVHEEAREAAKAASEAGVSDSAIARTLQVGRQTVLEWLGKRTRSARNKGVDTATGDV